MRKRKMLTEVLLLPIAVIFAAQVDAFALLGAAVRTHGDHLYRRHHYFWSSSSSTSSTTTVLHETTQQQQSEVGSTTTSLESISESLEEALSACPKNEVTKTCKVKLAPIVDDDNDDNHRLGLVATQNIKKGEAVLAVPYDDRFVLTANLARKTVFENVLPEDYDGWTGDAGLIALLILNEVARSSLSSGSEGNPGIALPKRPEAIQNFVDAWIRCLPGPGELKDRHPLLWSEDDQEVLQSSSTNKIYKKLDDLEEDAAWLTEHVFSKDRERFPEAVRWKDGEESLPCFCTEGLKWAMALVQSRALFLDGALRLIPLLDMCNHSDDDDAQEIQDTGMGTFGNLKGGQLVAGSRGYKAGEQVFCSYGPKSAADYLLDHGFCPESCWRTSVSELTFEIDSEDRFCDDKLDILEFETYEQAPMDPVQSFDVVSAPGRDGEPDPAMIQFVRLAKLGGTDAFLLESIFRKEAWGFMSLPVSEANELDVVNTVIEACQDALDDTNKCPTGGPEVCARLRESETKALTRTMEFLLREREALDLKEYYQERRLKDLGLDSEWSMEDDDMNNPDLGFGQTRAPGGADYDW